jgi:hypothetical protein
LGFHECFTTSRFNSFADATVIRAACTTARVVSGTLPVNLPLAICANAQDHVSATARNSILVVANVSSFFSAQFAWKLAGGQI